MDVTYPGEPWDLHGDATAGVFLVPVSKLPELPPPGTRVITVAGRAIVTAAFFRYREPSPLTYGEVMATVLVRRRWRPRVFIPQIWVDSPASRDGGRQLWAIPKDLAQFAGDPGTSMVGDELASVTVSRTRRLPGRWRTSFRVAQWRGGRGFVTPVAGQVEASTARAHWRFGGALAWLTGRRPLLTVHVRRFHLLFGRH
ncbi:acetoacetate decarboxylase family protein [Aeromicrobium sp. CTD01-1L150]|uniref:acetoacetate decarboxylase family protein n=1 Tax=Aeromicrobium sp. CTD01-1L150 TaxID=3341830 RepID=UPI0035C16BE4